MMSSCSVLFLAPLLLVPGLTRADALPEASAASRPASAPPNACAPAVSAPIVDVTHCEVSQEGRVYIEASIRNESDQPISIRACNVGSFAKFSYNIISLDAGEKLDLCRFPISDTWPGFILLAPGASERVHLCFVAVHASPGEYRVILRSDDGQLQSEPFVIKIEREYRNEVPEK